MPGNHATCMRGAGSDHATIGGGTAALRHCGTAALRHWRHWRCAEGDHPNGGDHAALRHCECDHTTTTGGRAAPCGTQATNTALPERR
jgi:hypothetical protein